ncbi:MAG: M3 family oligoendopeptidase [Bacteroidota bacterium]
MKRDFSKPVPKKRQFLPIDFKLTQWESLRPCYEQLLHRPFATLAALRSWLLDRSELEGALAEDASWLYINMACDTTHEGHRQQYEAYVKDILPQIMPLAHRLDEQAVQCPHAQALRQEAGFDLLLRCLANNIRLYRTENIPILTQLKLREQEYSKMAGAMTVAVGGQELTLPQAAIHLEAPDRALREEVYQKMQHRRWQDKAILDGLYTTLVKDRHQVALNAGFENFRDYSFAALQRFDYTPQDCFSFHHGVQKAVVPLLDELARERQAMLGVAVLKPWDQAVDPTGKSSLKPFSDGADLLHKTIMTFDRLDTSLGDCLRTMEAMGRIDLVSRKGKAPGGYNCPLEESGVPFIFMNAAAKFKDMITMLHEGGHAIHTFLMHDLPINHFKHITAEMGELASMSMELLTMDHWDIFFEEADDLKRAKKQHLEQIISRLAWIATIDKFQHWVYENPHHTLEQRRIAWSDILSSFSEHVTDWSGQEPYKDFMWQQQLHLFQEPFYYIEYGIAQLGAIAVWRNYQQNPVQGLRKYLNALKLGYTRSLPDMYATAGIAFDFRRTYIQELVTFVRDQWQAIRSH